MDQPKKQPNDQQEKNEQRGVQKDFPAYKQPAQEPYQPKSNEGSFARATGSPAGWTSPPPTPTMHGGSQAYPSNYGTGYQGGTGRPPTQMGSQFPQTQHGFQQAGQQIAGQQMMPPMGQTMPYPPMSGGPMFPMNGAIPRERSYIENILRLNRGKRATVYMTFENNEEWNARIFRGIIREAGRDHVVLESTDDGRWYLLLMIYLDYVVFQEPIEYDYPYA